MANVLAVIPARLGSTRLPEKPLKDIAGKPLVQWVWERACRCQTVRRAVVATDSDEIAGLVRGFGGEVVMTSPEITTGSARVAVAADQLAEQHGAWDLVVNIQGDMPFLEPSVIDSTVSVLAQDAENAFDMATLATPITDAEAYTNPMTVKVVVADNRQALYFSRASIPRSRDGARLGADGSIFGYKHIGLYVFRPALLHFFATAEQSPLEQVEMLEQLRALEAGYRIGVYTASADETRNCIEIDTPDDLDRAQEIGRKLSV